MKTLREQKEAALQESISAAYHYDCAYGTGGYEQSRYIDQDGKPHKQYQDAMDNENVFLDEFNKILRED